MVLLPTTHWPLGLDSAQVLANNIANNTLLHAFVAGDGTSVAGNSMEVFFSFFSVETSGARWIDGWSSIPLMICGQSVLLARLAEG
eukprot:360901-Rhodomonas_salina.2